MEHSATIQTEVLQALTDLVEAVKELREDGEGRWPLEPTCEECTDGSTPVKYLRGLCVYHRAEKALLHAIGGQ